ncbi:MAG: carbohydrate binding family 9 domain-containing protein, partial [bacterium]|nr:carbohydrate binding family 9 domain-containing protein [bacterium]
MLSTAAAFGAEPPVALALRVRQPIEVDGKLSEEAWQEAAPIGAFTQREPKSGVPPTEPTEVRVLYDENFLYIGIRCFDSRPESTLATQMGRDAELDRDDRVEILIDSFRDGRNAYYFATNPAGALVDGRITESQEPGLDWDAVWDLRTQTDNRGWTAEFQIPFQSIGFNRSARIWGFNVSRTLARLR